MLSLLQQESYFGITDTISLQAKDPQKPQKLNHDEDDGGRIAINLDKFDKLITSLRTAVDNDGALDKKATSYNDIFDAFRLALKFYHFEVKTN